MGHIAVKANNAPDRSDWLSQPEFLNLVRRVGSIALDPATSRENPTGARFFFARLGDPPGVPPANWLGPCGLAAPWPNVGLTYVNPPWGAHLSGDVKPSRRIMRNGALVGVGSGWAARIALHEGETIALVPTRTDSAWFAHLHDWCAWRLDWRSPTIGARLQFVDPDTGKTRGGNNTACSVFYRGPNVIAFLDVFGGHGELVPGRRLARSLAGLVRRNPLTY